MRASSALGQHSFIPFALPDITEAEINAVTDTVRSGWLTTGPNAAAFEDEFAAAVETDAHCISVNSATAGLHLAVEALGLTSGDEVLVPTWTFTSSAEIVRYVGATPIVVDVDPQTLNIDFAAAAEKLTDRTKAIIPVHFAGLPVPRHELDTFARTHQLAVIEDAAHAFPVRSDRTMIGSGASDAVVFSFYATKTLAAGEGGMLVTANDDIANRARVMRLHGISRDVFDRYTSRKPSWQYDVVAPGFKYNLPDTSAAIGRVQLERAVEMRQKRSAIADRYLQAFADLPVQLPSGPTEPEGHSWHLFVLRLHPEAPIDRDTFIQRCADKGVGCSVHFIPLHLHSYYRDTYNLKPEDYPVASKQFQHAVSLPIWSAMTAEQVERVITVVRSLLV
ncbi:MAG: DegT/DnrJ/EryC1/StrS aminotransferase family protein [Bowdeniella nasicola]|nr:DegT/DnrJ/EryC1/StrS aminotransferase family protein [Bowdeniella nasicola]